RLLRFVEPFRLPQQCPPFAPAPGYVRRLGRRASLPAALPLLIPVDALRAAGPRAAVVAVFALIAFPSRAAVVSLRSRPTVFAMAEHARVVRPERLIDPRL